MSEFIPKPIFPRSDAPCHPPFSSMSADPLIFLQLLLVKWLLDPTLEPTLNPRVAHRLETHPLRAMTRSISTLSHPPSPIKGGD